MSSNAPFGTAARRCLVLTAFACCVLSVVHLRTQVSHWVLSSKAQSLQASRGILSQMPQEIAGESYHLLQKQQPKTLAIASPHEVEPRRSTQPRPHGALVSCTAVVACLGYLMVRMILRPKAMDAEHAMPMATSTAMYDPSHPLLLEAIDEITEAEARRAIPQITRVPVSVPPTLSSEPILTSFLGPRYPDPSVEDPTPNQAPLVLLHGFDSNCLEWRHALPLLSQRNISCYAFDILGWGFAERSPSIQSYSPEAKRLHLHSYWKQHLGGRPMILVGASVGGAMAVDFAYHYPQAVEKLILVAPQCFIDGVPPTPDFLAKLGIRLLKSKWLRNQVTQQAYNTPDAGDAMLIGRLHTLMDRYDDSALSFIQSGGYKVSSLVSQLTQPMMVIWGQQDQILPPDRYLPQLQAMRPDAELVFVEDSGHVPHCIRPEAFVEAVEKFVRGDRGSV